jgi:hypothetical protein
LSSFRLCFSTSPYDISGKRRAHMDLRAAIG